MTLFKDIRQKLKNRELDEAFLKVYSKSRLDEQYERFLQVTDDFTECYGESSQREAALFSSPGRTEVCGNHTDHNHGRVLAASISLDAIAVASKNSSGIVRIKSRGYKMDVADCAHLEPDDRFAGKSLALVTGILARLKQLGYNIGGFDATTASQVLSGSGLSSSAAFEVLVCTIVSHLYNDGKIDPVTVAQVSQYAENVYFKKPCGLLDQTACSVGSFVTIDFNEPTNPIIKKVDFDFASCGHSLCIVDTKGDHSDLTDEYAAVRREMESVAAFFGKSVLRQCSREEVLENAGRLRESLGDRAVLRALHFFDDDERVQKQVQALEDGDFELFKALIIESGRSSYMYNQNVYSCAEPSNQPLSLALAVSEQLLKGAGAWRVHGGGFAGTIQAFVPNELLQKYCSTMNGIFGKDACYVLEIRPYGGVRLH